MAQQRNEVFGHFQTSTNQTCDECGCKLYKHMRSGSRECRNGHRPSADICEDCGEEIMETHLGDLCGCDNE